MRNEVNIRHIARDCLAITDLSLVQLVDTVKVTLNNKNLYRIMKAVNRMLGNQAIDR